MIKTIQAGSRAFFSNYEDFQPSDNDLIKFDDEQTVDFYSSFEDDVHIFHYRHMSKDELFSFIYNYSFQNPLVVCTFTLPEVAEFYDISISEMFLFEDRFNYLTRRHNYMKFIFSCYVENGEYSLTQAQLDKAYEMYKQNKH